MKRSLRALDALNLCKAGLVTGLGPFMSIWNASTRHWDPRQIGILIAGQSVAGVLVQTLVGRFVDETRQRRLLMSSAAAVISISSLCIVVLKPYAAN
jgi:MFS family permease